MKATEYKVLSNNSLDYLASDVNSMIDNGWQPLGHIVIIATSFSPNGQPENYCFYQTMVKM